MTQEINSTFIPPYSLNTAVLFLVFNRLDTTKRVFEAIRKAKPPRLYIASDGARENKKGEAEKVKAVRNFITQNIDWDCEFKMLYRDQNLGCNYAVSGALSWFFENEEQGIILEDDCLPCQSFFWFCENLLERYRDDERVGQISGFNILQKNEGFRESYTFLTGGSIWGWATWRRVYLQYETYNSASVDEIFQCILEFTDDFNESVHIRKNLDLVRAGLLSSWAYDWGAMLKANSQLSISPSVNLIINVGFGEDATHTTSGIWVPDSKDIDVQKLIHPLFIAPNKKQSKHQASLHVSGSFIKKVLRKLKRII
jgi:hypothetical protein